MLEYFLGIITSPFILAILIIGYVVLMRVVRASRKAPKYIPEDEQKFHEIVLKSEEVVGSFQGKPIHKTLSLDNGKTYIFESIAVEHEPNVFIAEHPKASYILYEGLLYRQVS